MTRLAEIVNKVRSKNAGPFWLTIDIFCGSNVAFARVSEGLQTADVATLLGTGPSLLKRFDISDLNVVKFSLPRPVRQGAIADRDMHGASFACLLSDVEL